MNITFQEAVALAKRSGACDEAIDAISQMKNWDEFSRHPDAPEWALWYARKVTKSRVPDLEPIIARDAWSAWQYANHVIGGRWPEAEPLIAQHSGYAYLYARDVIRGRWPEAEPVIAAEPGCAYRYAIDVVRGRWPEAERVIALNPGDMEAQGALGNWLAFGGDWDSGRRLAEAALTLAGPSAPTWWHQATAKGFYHKGEYEKAYQAFLLSYAEGSWLDLLHVVYTLPYLGRTEEAKARIPELIKLMPNMSVRLANQHYKMWCFDDDYIAKMDKALRMAGLRETADAPPTEALASKP